MNRYFLHVALGLWLLACFTNVQSQLTPADYTRADSVALFRDKVYNIVQNPAWAKDTHIFTYQIKSRKGYEYFLVNATEKTRQHAFDHEDLARQLSEQTDSTYKAFQISLENLTYNDDFTYIEFLLDGDKWKYNRNTLSLTSVVDKTNNYSIERPHWAASRDERNHPPVVSPDSLWTAFVEDNNVFITCTKSEKKIQLSHDGSCGEYYSSLLQWSPDSRYLATNKIRPHQKQYMYRIESTPKDQLLPKLHKLEYPRPGDALQIRMPSVFCIDHQRKIELDTDRFIHQFNLTTPQWREDSRAFTFEFNKRGHQVYQVVQVSVPNGQVEVLINETSSTFIDYSGKKFRHDVNDGQEIIWASERDGWNHLYLYSFGRRNRVRQITKGDWVVRGVDYVDQEKRMIYFRGAGKAQDEDPYLVKYYSIDFEGKNLVELTPEEANHHAYFSHDHKWLVDVYSRIDMPPVSVLRRASDGQIHMHLEQADIHDIIELGWQVPEVFSAPGRDGETMIWGNIYRPSNFDPTISYPVIEAIYAGPHAAHVPKSFTPYFGHFSALAELGFIIVQIDGMGTSYRSKAFHDVCWKNLKDAGFPDRILWMQAAAQKFPYMDITRVGIFGGSAGGQNAMGALLFHPEFYSVAVASVGCHDNRVDKIWWNEQWMGYPIGEHYKESSNVVNAHKLQGRLMLTVGELDDNVDPSSTLQVVDALIKAGKDFELLVFPGHGHGAGGAYGERRKRDFFVRHLLKQETPHWNTVK